MIDPDGQPNPRLTRLELHGFKSFASKTTFVFEAGITAVVGPNGSGKSNISDAIRWVLGETSYSSLRSKKTEDVIFAGGKGKAPAGMAEVTVTFDNETHWLPTDFTEVTVTRRAFRGGDTQYFINGRRVRLKDVAQLTASLGHSYTVVGQGLVDAALSQRAEERRGLFEHAADLTGLRLKVQGAERNLAESDGNIERLTDLLAEVEPNLRRLERAAKQAREWQGLRDRLTSLQRGHYRRLLIAANERLAEAERLAADDEAAMREVQEQLDALTSGRADRQQARAQAAEALAAHDVRLQALQEQHRRFTHERELVAERQVALNRRREDMQDTQSDLDVQVAQVEAELQAVDETLAALRAEVTNARRDVEGLEAAAVAERKARGELERETTELAREIARQERAAADLLQRRALLVQRQESAEGERQRADREAAERAERIAGLEGELVAFEEADREIAAQIAGQDARLEEIRSTLQRHQDEAKAAAAALAELERRHAQATNRLDVLQRVHESGTGLHQGVRQVMQWARAGSLTGIRGTLAELIAVDPEYDTALEVALGGHLQDVVVERWRDAEAAIGMLKRARAGRATFQPLDTVGRRAGYRPPPREIDGTAGVHGVASDLAHSDDDVAGVVRALLGRIVVVEDLPTARRLLDALPNGWSTVTLSGEIARSGGSVTGGSAVRESGVLGRERELRELPTQVKNLEGERAAAGERQRRIAELSRTQAEERSSVESARAGLMAQRRERSGQRDRLASWLRDLRQQQEVSERQSSAAEASRAEQQQEIAALEARHQAVRAALDGQRARHEALVRALDDRRAAATEDDGAVSTARGQLVALEERLRAEDRRRGSLLSRRSGLGEEIALRNRRAAELDTEREALAGQRTRHDADIDALAQTIAIAMQEREPLQAAVATADEAVRERDAALETTRQEAMARERSVGQRGLLVERARDELDTIHLRIMEGLEYENPDDLASEELDDDTASEDLEATDHEIGRLRDRLRRVGYVGDDVVGEFERESERQAFMRSQLADVQAAAASLREMIADLHETMRQRFEVTFAKVAEAFSEAFTTLFGGGTARLVLTAEDEGAPGGIDIVAQPPGKRLQGLGLLSGGERSLTAVALLFAILRVNPSPFVLLDEVDAALDEANVVRFRDELRSLGDQTQAIVITHNRGTVEIADTLYGVTMGGDGVSQVLSLRLSELPLDEDIDIRDLPAISAGIPVR